MIIARTAFFGICTFVVAAMAAGIYDQGAGAAAPVTQTVIDNAATGKGMLAVTLLDQDHQANLKSAAVEVKVMGIRLIDSSLASEVTVPGQGHLRYKIDEGPVIATTATKLTFQELSSGFHQITVWLADNNHQLLGPYQTFTVRIP